LVAAAVVALRLTVFAAEAVPVTVAAVDRGRVEETVTNSRAGTVKAERRARLSPETGGKVVELPFREGDAVRAGDVVLRLEASAQRAQLELAARDQAAARARREEACLGAAHAERERRRLERLAAEGIASADLLDAAVSGSERAAAACVAAEAGLGRAAAAVDLARTEVTRTELRAPFDAVVAELQIEVGEWTTPSPPAVPVPPVIDLIDSSSLYISAPMDEVDSARIRPGQAARVTLDPYPGQSFAARVARLAPYVLDREEQNRTVEVEAELEHRPDGGLLPGTSADVEVVLSAREDVLRVPTAALVEGGRVLVVEDGVLVEKTVEVGLRNWDWTEVLSGLAAGDPVVTSLDRPEVKAGARARVTAEPAGSGSR
jgi:HlyD family secretion protein